MNLRCLFLAIIFSTFVNGSVKADDLFNVKKIMWKPAEDNVYLQEVSEKIPTDDIVKSVAVYKNKIYAFG